MPTRIFACFDFVRRWSTRRRKIITDELTSFTTANWTTFVMVKYKETTTSCFNTCNSMHLSTKLVFRRRWISSSGLLLWAVPFRVFLVSFHGYFRINLINSVVAPLPFRLLRLRVVVIGTGRASSVGCFTFELFSK